MEETAPRELTRRHLLRGVFLGLGAASLPSWVLKSSVARAQRMGGSELTMPAGPLASQDFGPLVAQVVEDELSGVSHQVYAPVDFHVRVVLRAGVSPISKRPNATPGHVYPDGGAVYPAPNGDGWVYVSNSEATPGGVCAIRFDPDGKIVDYYPICSETRRNCAGGQTPWGTWITCEEVSGGWAFECDPFGTPASQRRLDALGARDRREAVAVDPVHHACYQTLDASAGQLVRFISDPADLEPMASGVVRMRFEKGVSQRLLIPAFETLPGFEDAVVPDTALGSSQLRHARPIEWVPDDAAPGTHFNGAEGIWYYEIPEPLRAVPTLGRVATRGLIFFATKGDSRIWAVDLDNDLIELIYDRHDDQAFPNLLSAGEASHFGDVDNVVVSPAGDVLVAEDGPSMRLAVVVNGQACRLLMQITRGGSEICGPAFTPDGSRLYFSSQRGPSGPSGTETAGVIYEMTIPPRFRAVQRARPFTFKKRLDVARGATITSRPVLIEGFEGSMVVTISAANSAQFSIDSGAWRSQPGIIEAGSSLRVRHTSSPGAGELTETTISVGLANGLARTNGVFASLTSRDADPPVEKRPDDPGTASTSGCNGRPGLVQRSDAHRQVRAPRTDTAQSSRRWPRPPRSDR